MRYLMSIRNHIYENMQTVAKVLATDPETKDRYEKAANGHHLARTNTKNRASLRA